MFKKFDSLLYIEDDEKIKINIVPFFEQYVKNVYTAKDGREGLDRFKKLKPQIVVSDIIMPKMNGIELLKEIRKISTKTQLIITSSFDDKDFLLEAVNLQLTNYILKPLTLKQLEYSLKLCEEQLLDSSKTNIFFSEDVYFDIQKKELFNEKDIIPLTSKERLFLEISIKNYPSPVTYTLLSNQMYEGIEMKDAIKAIVKQLRKKIPDSIETIYGYGYKINFIKN